MLVLPEDKLSQLLVNLDQEQCEKILQTFSDALATCSAQSKLSEQQQEQKQIHQPLRSSIVTSHGDTTLFMPVSDTLSTSIKIVTVPKKGPIRGVINVLSPQGALLGVISAAEVTAFRTALATMTLFSRCKWLFDSKKAQIIVFGAGRQAEWHARLALLLLSEEKIEGITFVNRGQERLDEMMTGLLPDLQQRYPNLKVTAYAKSALQPEEYASRLTSDLAESNVVFCCTPSTEPLFAYDAITANRNQRFISMIGSYKPHMQEVDKQTLLSGTEGRIYVDSKHACLEEAGELIMAGVQESQLVEAGEAFGQDPGLESERGPGSGNIVFKCVGMGIMDLVVAKTLLEMAAERGLGTKVDF
ncbi:hypothetical protein PISL3812_07820 [Talaromyces islandicus]|uniref:Ornithine cyclodeaminase n=1 Tax=Talaromyces islandicus TaxID=28573 RepID=A0A0U1M5F0_TALIS|nr:hypothetical protein PISL3812_07820 [Talaromyces islandicus]